MTTCPHEWERTWKCDHGPRFSVSFIGFALHEGRSQHIEGKCRCVYRCTLCGEPGFALHDGVQSRTRPAVSLTGSRGEA